MRFLAFAIALLSSAFPMWEASADRALARALVEEGTALREAGRTAEALERYEQAIAQDPDYLQAYDAAAWLWLGVERYDTAIRHLERATTRHPDYSFGWYTLAIAYRNTGRHDLAIISYETCISLRPQDPDPYYGLAATHKRAGNLDEASLALQRYLILESRPERAEFIARARAALEELGVEPPPAAATATGERLEFARQLLADRRLATALAALSQVAPQSVEQRSELWHLRARAHLGAGRAELAIDAALVALASDPDPAVYETLARAYLESDQPALAAYYRALAE